MTTLIAAVHIAAVKAAHAAAPHTTVQWTTLAWIVGTVVVATLIIAVIVVMSRRPKSMEDGMAEFSRSLQAVAPTHRLAQRAAPANLRPGTSNAPDERPLRPSRGETKPV
jgi:hypothetical protein